MGDSVSPKFIAIARKLIGNHPVICDIGSRDAIEGISLFRQLEAARLHVFEPNPMAAELCRKNISQLRVSSGRDSVVFNQLAVSDKVGPLKFYPVNPTLSENKDIGFSSLFQVNPGYTRRRGRVVQDEVIVSTTTLDEYFAGKQLPDLLWIDVEGAELQVFKGASSVLRSVRLIHVEVSFRPMQIGKPLFWEIQDYLGRLNFAFCGFADVSRLRGFLYRHRLLPNLPWRLNAIFCRAGSEGYYCCES